MPRRAARTYAAIEHGFQALEQKEAQLKRYYKPFDEQELEHISGDFSLCSSSRHRYADVLQWGDDVSAMLGGDDPALVEMLKRRHSRAVSALQRTRAASHHSPGGKGAKAVRPNSAPPGFDPVPVGSALQAALMGALESVQTPASSHSSSLAFESRLLDEYLRCQSLRPDRPGSAQGPDTVSAAHAQQAAPAAAAPVRPVSGGMRQMHSTDLLDLPLIDEGVEEVEEGMDGEELAQDARLMYYGSRRPRGSSAARAGSGSPGARSGSPGAVRPVSASVHGSRPTSAVARAAAAGASTTSQQQQQGQHSIPQRPQSAHLPPRPHSAVVRMGGEGRHGASLATSPPTASARPWSANPTTTTATTSVHHTGPQQLRGSQSMVTPVRSSWGSSTGVTGHAELRPVTPSGTGAASSTHVHASHTKLRSHGSLALQASSLCLEGAGSARGSPRAAGVGKAAAVPFNGIITRNPAGPPVATKRAQRPMSAKAAADRDRGLQQACAAATAHWSKAKRPASAASVPITLVSFPDQTECAPGPEPLLVQACSGPGSHARSTGALKTVTPESGAAAPDVGRHSEVKSMMALQAARHASVVRMSALHGLQPVA